MNCASPLGALLTLGVLSLPSKALEIEFRYNLDSGDFFAQPGAKEALEAAGSFYEELITDELEALDPGNFQGGPQQNWNPTYLEPGQSGSGSAVPGANNLVVPANTLVIFVGGRALSTTAQGGPGGFNPQGTTSLDWFNQLLNRGEEGATTYTGGSFSANPSDFAPWGGTVFFNQDLSWNFSTSDATLPGIDFIPAALHEIGHVLGLGNFGSQTSSWIPLVSGSKFEGPLAKLSNGNVDPALNGGVHWSGSLANNRTVAVFGREHGESQKPLMQALVSSSAANLFAVPTDLELAALRDIGWELVAAAADFKVKFNADPTAPGIAIPTTTGTSYQVRRSDSLGTLAPTGSALIGDGSIQTWIDPVGPALKAFYDVEACPIPAGGSKSAGQTLKKSATITPSFSEDGFPEIAPSQCECLLH